MNPDEKKILSKYMKLCSAGEKCEMQIRQKLLKDGIRGSLQQKIISQLYKENFIDNARFARSFTNDKFHINHWGKIKIAYALRQNRLTASQIENALNQIDENEYLLVLKKLLEKKRETVKLNNKDKLQQSLYRFGLSRGFEPYLVEQCVFEITNKTK